MKVSIRVFINPGVIILLLSVIFYYGCYKPTDINLNNTFWSNCTDLDSSFEMCNEIEFSVDSFKLDIMILLKSSHDIIIDEITGTYEISYKEKVNKITLHPLFKDAEALPDDIKQINLVLKKIDGSEVIIAQDDYLELSDFAPTFLSKYEMKKSLFETFNKEYLSSEDSSNLVPFEIGSLK